VLAIVGLLAIGGILLLVVLVVIILALRD